MHESELKKQKNIKENLESSYREDYPVVAHTRSNVNVKAHTRGETINKKFFLTPFKYKGKQGEYLILIRKYIDGKRVHWRYQITLGDKKWEREYGIGGALRGIKTLEELKKHLRDKIREIEGRKPIDRTIIKVKNRASIVQSVKNKLKGDPSIPINMHFYDHDKGEWSLQLEIVDNEDPENEEEWLISYEDLEVYLEDRNTQKRFLERYLESLSDGSLNDKIYKAKWKMTQTKIKEVGPGIYEMKFYHFGKPFEVI